MSALAEEVARQVERNAALKARITEIEAQTAEIEAQTAEITALTLDLRTALDSGAALAVVRAKNVALKARLAGVLGGAP